MDWRHVGLRQEQIRTLRLPESVAEPKTGSQNWERFVARYGLNQKVYELEAVPPTVLQSVLRKAIRSALDMNAFESERQQEEADSAELTTRRKKLLRIMK